MTFVNQAGNQAPPSHELIDNLAKFCFVNPATSGIGSAPELIFEYHLGKARDRCQPRLERFDAAHTVVHLPKVWSQEWRIRKAPGTSAECMPVIDHLDHESGTGSMIPKENCLTAIRIS